MRTGELFDLTYHFLLYLFLTWLVLMHSAIFPNVYGAKPNLGNQNMSICWDFERRNKIDFLLIMLK